MTTTQEPKASWYAQWSCSCGDAGDAHADDGTTVDADHDCATGQYQCRAIAMPRFCRTKISSVRAPRDLSEHQLDGLAS